MTAVREVWSSWGYEVKWLIETMQALRIGVSCGVVDGCGEISCGQNVCLQVGRVASSSFCGLACIACTACHLTAVALTVLLQHTVEQAQLNGACGRQRRRYCFRLVRLLWWSSIAAAMELHKGMLA
jgi:hypothetical protein